MMDHRGLVSLEQNYFKTNLMELTVEYIKVVPDLTIDDSERLEQSNRRMAENIQTLEGEKDTKIERLERQIRSMEEEMSNISDRGGATADEILSAFLKSPKSGGVPGEVMESFTVMMKQMGAAQETAMCGMKYIHDAAMADMKADHDAKMDRLLRRLDRMAKEDNAGHDPPAGPGEDAPRRGTARPRSALGARPQRPARCSPEAAAGAPGQISAGSEALHML